MKRPKRKQPALQPVEPTGRRPDPEVVRIEVHTPLAARIFWTMRGHYLREYGRTVH